MRATETLTSESRRLAKMPSSLSVFSNKSGLSIPQQATVTLAAFAGGSGPFSCHKTQQKTLKSKMRKTRKYRIMAQKFENAMKAGIQR